MDTIIGTILQNLSSPVLKEFGIIWNLKDEKQRIQSTVSAIKAVLVDAEAKATTNHQISNWLEELKDVLFDADDLIDDFSTEDFRRKLMVGNNMTKKVQIFFSKSNQIAYAYKMGHKMLNIRKRLDDIANDKDKFQLIDCAVETPVVYRERRQTYSFVRKDEVIGREEETRVIKSYLLDSNVTDNVSIIPVVGIGGLGKTTLAQLVYNDNDVQNYFEQTMWVCVLDDFDIKKIAQQMIGHDKNNEIEQVQQDLRNKIQGKKYLLVLDDVWNEDRELWLKLKSLLMEGGKGSMVIVTTRSHTVAKIMGTDPPLFLKGLDLERSWKLFSQVAFNEGKEPNDLQLLATGRDIVKKCAGVPIAIRTISSLLYSRNLGHSDWLYFRDVEFSKIDQQKDKIFAILKLSYDHLPSNLKNCFAYFSLFPKGFMFEKKTLIQLWAAEGFTQPSDDIRCVEDVGHEYFMNLLSMSFFQDVTIDDLGDVSTCKMHDLIHDLAKLVAGKEFAVVEGKEVSIGKRTRYLSYHTLVHFAQTLSSSLLRGEKLRTFLVPGQPSYARADLDHINFGSLLSLKFLRVLTLCGLDIIAIPKSIKELKHLRYADLSWNPMLESLPLEITSLHNLQTLKLSHCIKVTELPADINKLISLRHLELNGCDGLICMPCGLGQLTSLQTLTHFVFVRRSRSGGVSELSGLNNLKGRLEMKWLDCLRDNAVEVGSAKVLLEKQHLLELELRWWYDVDSELQLWLVNGRRLEMAKQNEDRGSEDEMILQGLQPHHSIKRLVIDGFCGKSLPGWIGNLSSLLVLEISNCNHLASLPEGIRDLRSLQRLCIYNCSRLEERCARKQGGDWPKIAHIPTVLIGPFTPSVLRYIN